MKAWVFTESYNNYKNKQRPGLVCSNKKPSTERTSICQTVGASIEVHILTGAQLDAIAKAAFEAGRETYIFRPGTPFEISGYRYLNLVDYLASDEYKKLVGEK